MAGFPAGPLGAIVVRDMIGGEIRKGFEKGLGAVTANLIYGLLVTFGISFVSGFLQKYQTPIRITGFVLIILMGLSILLGNKQKNEEHSPPAKFKSASSFFTGFFIALTNPSKIFIYTGLVSFLGMEAVTGGFSIGALFMVVGIACGCSIWWILLLIGARIFKRHTGGGLKSPKLNIIFGILVMLFGIAFLVNGIIKGL